MTLTRETMLERFLARDEAMDGRFFVGVVTTGIYCLPSCPARKPRARNVRFFGTPTEALRAGLRACKRCRPDRFEAGEEPELDALEGLAARIRRAPGAYADARAVAREAGCGVTTLARRFRAHLHTTPAAFLLDARVAEARRRLLASDATLRDVALDVGLESSSAFHDAFRRLAFLTPGAYRRIPRSRAFTLALPADYRVEDALGRFDRYEDSPTEHVRGRTLVRALRLGGRPATLELAVGRGRVRARVEARGALSRATAREAHEAALRLLGLVADPSPFERRARREPAVRTLVRRRPGLRIEQTPTVFEGLAWTVVGQQVHLAFASECRTAFVELAGERAPSGLLTHPTAERAAELDHADLTRRRFSRRKSEYLIDTARSVAAGELDLEGLRAATATRAERTLLALRGIGPWSANYVLMRSLAFGDCLAVGDAGLVAALRRRFDLDERPDADAQTALMERFRPHRSLATLHLWCSLGDDA